MATKNLHWDEEYIANKLFLKLGITVSPRTVRKYIHRRPRGRLRGDLRAQTFLRLHAQGIPACDFWLAIAESFRMLDIFVMIEHDTRRLVYYNVTAYPTTEWTLQLLREAIGIDHRYRFPPHDRESIFSRELDDSIRALGINALRSGPNSPKMNALCGRIVGTLPTECLNWAVPLSESHLRILLRA